MAHKNIPKVYHRLQHRLDKYPVGAPESASLYKILKILYSPEDAEVAVNMPLRFVSLAELSKRMHQPEKELKGRLTKMAENGLVFDTEKEGGSYYMLMPTVVGSFEFSLMRIRDDIDQKHLSELYHKLFDEGKFIKAAFEGETQIGRALVYEEVIPADMYSEIMPYEKASSVIEDSKSFSVGICYCRHKSSHTGYTCKFQLESCMSFGEGAEYLIRNKLAKRIEKSQAQELLAKSQEAGLIHIADNIQKNVSYICNCCGCCCGQLNAINKFSIYNAVVTSNFIADVNLDKCNGCGVCARKCNINAITLKGTAIPGELRAEVNKDMCLGCGVCAYFCKKLAMSMNPRKQKTIIPETTIERVITMALERGKIQNLIFDSESGFWFLHLNKFLETIQKLPLIKKQLLNKQLKSTFVSAILQEAKRRDKTAAKI